MLTINSTTIQVEPTDIAGRFVIHAATSVSLRLSGMGGFVPGDYVTIVNSGGSPITVSNNPDDTTPAVVYSTFANGLILQPGMVTRVIYRGPYNSAAPFGSIPIPSATDGDSVWEVEKLSAATALAGLSDVLISGMYPPEAGQVLQYNGTHWAPSTLGPNKQRPYAVYSIGATVGTSLDHGTYYTALGGETTQILDESTITGGDFWDDNSGFPLDPGPMPIGGWFNICHTNIVGAPVTVNVPPAVTLLNNPGLVRLVEAGSSVRFIKLGYNIWYVEGTLALAAG